MTCNKCKPVHTVLSTSMLILAAIMIGSAVFLKISQLPRVEAALGVLQVHSEEPLFDDNRQSIADIKALKEMIYTVSFAANIFLLIGGLLFVRAFILVSVM